MSKRDTAFRRCDQRNERPTHRKRNIDEEVALHTVEVRPLRGIVSQRGVARNALLLQYDRSAF